MMSRRAELGAGEGGEMTQTLYAHMNKRKKKKSSVNVLKKRTAELEF
jgi:hypothetical protein